MKIEFSEAQTERLQNCNQKIKQKKLSNAKSNKQQTTERQIEREKKGNIHRIVCIHVLILLWICDWKTSYRSCWCFLVRSLFFFFCFTIRRRISRRKHFEIVKKQKRFSLLRVLNWTSRQLTTGAIRILIHWYIHCTVVIYV